MEDGDSKGEVKGEMGKWGVLFVRREGKIIKMSEKVMRNHTTIYKKKNL